MTTTGEGAKTMRLFNLNNKNMLLSSIFRKYFHHFPIEYYSDKDFKILYHEHLDYCRTDFNEFNVLVCDNEKIFKSKALDRCPAFIRFNFLTRDKTYYLKAIEPKNYLVSP